jgi:predicted  nucleic acid-binding Zn-ribbon protein
MSIIDNFEYRNLYYESKQVISALREALNIVKEEKQQLINKVSQLDERVGKLEGKISKLELDNQMSKKQVELESGLLKDEIAKIKALGEKWESAITALKDATTTIDMERLKLKKLRENTEDFQKN